VVLSASDSLPRRTLEQVVIRIQAKGQRVKVLTSTTHPKQPGLYHSNWSPPIYDIEGPIRQETVSDVAN
jgi:hypothetical protein